MKIFFVMVSIFGLVSLGQSIPSLSEEFRKLFGYPPSKNYEKEREHAAAEIDFGYWWLFADFEYRNWNYKVGPMSNPVTICEATMRCFLQDKATTVTLINGKRIENSAIIHSILMRMAPIEVRTLSCYVTCTGVFWRYGDFVQRRVTSFTTHFEVSRGGRDRKEEQKAGDGVERYFMYVFMRRATPPNSLKLMGKTSIRAVPEEQ